MDIAQMSPLHLAAQGNHKDVVVALLKKRANPMLLSKAGKLPRELATDDQVVEMLKQHEQKKAKGEEEEEEEEKEQKDAPSAKDSKGESMRRHVSLFQPKSGARFLMTMMMMMMATTTCSSAEASSCK